MSIDHAYLVSRAARWLKQSRRCDAVLTRKRMWMSEEPDAIGWNIYCRSSILVECKASRADFFRDRDKFFRAHPECGVGTRRYYLTPPKLVSVDELPEHWGLLECFPTFVRVVRESDEFEKCYPAEFRMLIALAAQERSDPPRAYELDGCALFDCGL